MGGANITFQVVEHVFTALFLVELLLRIAVYRGPYFMVVANWMDIVIVLFSVLELWVLSVIDSDGSGLGVNLTFMRVLRVARLVRMLRVVRVMRMFHELRVLVRTIQSSSSALLWSLVLLTGIMVLSSIFVVQVLSTYIQDENLSHEMRLLLFTNFGSFSRGMLTMFEITIPGLGGWGSVVHIVIDEVDPAFGIFFTFYVAVVCFASLRVISALFIKQTMLIASSDDETVLQERMRQKGRYVYTLRQAFNDVAPKQHHGSVNEEEFQIIMKDRRVINCLTVLECEITNVSKLFMLLDSGSGRINCDEFLAGMFHMKGGAKSMDVVTLIYETQKITRIAQDIHQRFSKQDLPEQEEHGDWLAIAEAQDAEY